MAGSAVWLDVIPSMSKFGSTMSKQAGAAARTAGVTAGKQFSAGIAAGSSNGAATSLVGELEAAAKRAARVVNVEKAAIAKARADEAAAAKGVEAAEAQLAASRVKNQAAAARIASSESQLAAARAKHGAASKQAAAAEQTLYRAQAAAQTVTAGTIKAEQSLIGARSKAETAGLKVVAVEDQLKAAFSEQKVVTTQLSAAQADSARQTAVMQSRFGRLAAAGAPLSSGLGKVAQGAKNVAANALATLKPLAGMAAGFGAIIGIGQVIKLGNAYTLSMNTLAAVTNASAKEMKAAAVVSRQLGSDLTLPATSGADAAAIMVELAKGGLSLQESMTAAKGTIQLAAAAQIDGAQAATIQANALNEFRLKATDASMVADVLANTASAASGEITDMALALKYVGPIARGVGVSIGDTGTAIGLLAKNGILADTAGTSLRTMLVRLAKPTKAQAVGLEELGINAFDAAGNFKGMRYVVAQLNKAQKGQSQQQFISNAAMAFGREPLAAITALASEGATSYDAMSKAVGRQGGAAAVAQAKMKGLGGAMDKLESQLEDVALGIYQTVTPALTGAVNGIAAGLDGAGDKVQKFLNVAGGLGKLAFTGKVTAPITGIDPSVVAGIQAARTVVVGAFKDIQSFVVQSLIPSLRNIAVAAGPVVAIVGGAFLLAFRAAAAVLQFIGPALVGITGFFRENRVASVLLAAAIGGLVLAYKAFVLQQKIAEAGGLATWAKKIRVVAAAQKAWTFATWLAVGAQKAYNLVLRNNPIGWVITILGALTGAVIYAYKNFAWFRTGVDAVWTGIQVGAKAVGAAAVWLWQTVFVPAWKGIAAVAQWAWATILKPTFDGIMLVVRAVAAVFTWWWQNITMPVFRGIAAVVGWMWNTVSAIFELVIAMVKFALAPVFTFLGAVAKASWNAIVGTVQWAWGLLSATFNVVIGFIRGTLGVAFSWLWSAVIKPVWNSIVTAVQIAWLGLRVVFGAISGFLRATLGPAFSWLYQNAIKPAWDGIKVAVKVVWDFLKPIFDKLVSVAKVAIPSAFSAMKDGIGKAWKAISDTAKAPIRFVVDTVINDALIGNFNKLATAFGTKKITPISLPKGFAGGGVIPGYSSVKRDDHLRPMRAGEGVLVPEVVRALGPGFVHSLNAAGNRGGVSGVRKATGYATGGIVGAGKDVLSGAIDATRNVASLATDLVTDPAGTITKAVKALIGKIPGAGSAVELAAGFGRKVLDSAVQSLQNMVGSFLPAGGTGANGSIPASQLGKAANYHPGGGVGPMGGYLRAPAAAAWNAMVNASGGMLTLTEGYRDLASQQYRWAQYKAGRGNLAAAPGTSVHGFGLAADIGAGQAWARANGAKYGWVNTGLGFSQREPWHFEYKGAKSKGYAAGGVVGGVTPTLYDKGGVIPRGTSLIQNNLRDPEVALPMQTLREIVSTGSGSAPHYEVKVDNNGRDLSANDIVTQFQRMETLANG